MVDQIDSYPPVKGSDFWKRKVRSSFSRLDANSDGVLTEEDFKGIACDLIKISNLKDKPAQQVKDAMHKIWTDYFKPETGTSLQVEAYIQKLLADVNGKLKHELCPLAEIMFDAIDVNRDGTISKKEFANLYEVWRIGAVSSSVVFDIIDSDSDGLISKKEWVHALIDFYFNEDPKSPYKVIFGSLI